MANRFAQYAEEKPGNRFSRFAAEKPEEDKPSFVGDFMRPVKAAGMKLAEDFKEDYARAGRMARGEERPAVRDAFDIGPGARLAGNALSLVASGFLGATDATVNRPIARAAIGAGLPVYSRDNSLTMAPRRLYGQEAEDTVAGDIGLALSGSKMLPRAAKPVAAPVKARPSVPSLEELKTSRKAAYKAVEGSGHTYSPESFADAIESIKGALRAEQFDPDFHPQVQIMVQRMEARAARGEPQTLADLDQLQRFIRKNVRGDANQRRLGGVISRGVDDYIDGQGGEGAELIGEARDLYKREKKVEAVTAAQAKSQRQAAKTGSGGNFDNTTRQNMDKILERNPYLTDDERAALENIVMGDKGQNALRAYGKTSPLAGGLSAQINAIGGVGTLGASGVLHSAPSSAAKLAADGITRKKVADLIDLMAVGGSREQLLAAQQQAQQIDGPTGSALRKLIAQRLGTAAAAVPLIAEGHELTRPDLPPQR